MQAGSPQMRQIIESLWILDLVWGFGQVLRAKHCGKVIIWTETFSLQVPSCVNRMLCFFLSVCLEANRPIAPVMPRPVFNKVWWEIWQFSLFIWSVLQQKPSLQFVFNNERWKDHGCVFLVGLLLFVWFTYGSMGQADWQETDAVEIQTKSLLSWCKRIGSDWVQEQLRKKKEREKCVKSSKPWDWIFSVDTVWIELWWKEYF